MEAIRNTVLAVKAPGRFGSPRAFFALFFSFLYFIFLLSTPCFAGEEESDSKEKKSSYSTSAALRPFEHSLTLHPYRGLPSEIAFRPRDRRPSSVRGIFVLDGFLLVVPFRYEPLKRVYLGSFPTPKTSLRYQFQMMFKNGKSILSEVFEVSPSCSSIEIEKMIRKSKKSKEQRKVLREAIALDQEVDVLQYLIHEVDSIMKRAN